VVVVVVVMRALIAQLSCRIDVGDTMAQRGAKVNGGSGPKELGPPRAYS